MGTMGSSMADGWIRQPRSYRMNPSSLTLNKPWRRTRTRVDDEEVDDLLVDRPQSTHYDAPTRRRSHVCGEHIKTFPGGVPRRAPPSPRVSATSGAGPSPRDGHGRDH